jgi:iron complex outermembrane recepter protein
VSKKILSKVVEKKNRTVIVCKPAVLTLLIASIGSGLPMSQVFAEASLDPVPVIGQRESTMTQPNMNQAIEAVKRIPGGASIVDMRVVGEGRVSTWTDSLGMAPGVFIQDRFGSEEARISMRGSALSRTFHSFGIKILQDGIPINYADGFFDMQTIDPSAARYVEVIRGANALGYGASTLGGAINYVSPTGYDSPKFLGRAEAGSFGYARLQAITGGVVKPTDGNGNVWDYNISANAMKQDGYRNHSAQNSEKVVANTGVKINADLESRFFVGVVRSRSQLPGTISKSRLLSTPTVAQDVELNQVWPSRFQRRDVDAQRIANKTVYKNGDTEYELATYVMHHDLWHPIRFGFIEQNTITYGGHIKVANKNKLFGSDNLLTFGYLPDFGTTQAKRSDGGLTPPFVQGDLKSDASQKSENHRFLVENKLKLNTETILITSLQYEEANRKKSDLLASSANYNTKYTQWIPRLGVIHNLNASSQVFANISKNFEPPIFDVATTMLAAKAQTGTTVEVGSRGEMSFNQGRDQGFWDVTFYRSQLKNEFQTICANNSISCGSSITANVPRTIHQGIELGAGALIDRHWETRTALLYSDFRFDGNAQYGNNRMPGFPPLIIRSELLYRWSDVTNSRGLPAYYAGPKLEWVPTKAPMDNTNSVYNDPYAIFGFKAGGPLDQNSSWFVDARNLTDKRYAATTNIAASYQGNAGAAYYPGMGRSINIGLETKW